MLMFTPSRYAGRASPVWLQFGFRTRVADLPGWYPIPRNLPLESAFSMYGPVAASNTSPYWVGFFLSSGAANSLGTGAVSGVDRAPVKNVPYGPVRLNTIVYLSGVEIPEIGPPFALLAPTM